MGKYKRYERYKDSGVEWIGEVPVGWEIKSFRHCINLIKNGTSLTQVQEETKYKVTRIETISTGKIDYEKVGYVNYSKELERYKLQKGDILFSNINSLEMVGNVALYKSKESLYSGMNLLRIVPNKECCNTWLYYFIKSNYFNNKVKSVAKHAVNQVSVPTGKIKEINIVKPSLEEQNQIADFLDQKTSEIDALVADKEKLITLLEEKRQAMITEAVTKGLDPNVKMKDSGVEWIGEVPKHWEIKKLKYIGEAIIGLTYSLSDITDEAGTLVLRSSNIQDTKIVFNDNVYVSLEIPNRLITKEGDIIICSRSGSRELIGKNAYIEKENAGLSFGAFMTIFRSTYNRYLRYVFNSTMFKNQSASFLTSTINQITINNLYSFLVPIPPIGDQTQIANFLDQKTAEINALNSEIRLQIQKLKEYRQSLISEAVTGKIDLRDKAGRFDD